jgi:hypothetical protein
MICIFFVPGMFGSTIEYVLRSFSNELDDLNATILEDGSMHSFKTQKHLTNKDDFISFFSDRDSLVSVITPIYPCKDSKLPDLLDICRPLLTDNDHRIIIYADSFEYAELNMLFQYHKIAMGQALQFGLDIFCGNNTSDIVQWNTNYTHWSQMKQWELREWFSFFYPQWIQEWLDAPGQIDSSWLKVSTRDILTNTEDTFANIITKSKLSVRHDELAKFSNGWRGKQQYIVNEYNLIEKIIENTLNSTEFAWESTNIIAEAIVQQRLRTAGFETQCDGLDIFPTNSLTLRDLLIPVN